MDAHVYINPRYNIVVQKFYNIVDQDILIHALGALYQNSAYLHTNKIITDFRGVQANIEHNAIDNISYFIKTNSKNTNFIRNAILVDKPYETALIFFYSGLMKDMINYDCQVCISESKAASVLCLTMTEFYEIGNISNPDNVMIL